MSAPSEPQHPFAIRYLPALVGMRAIAALLVLLLHTNQLLPAGTPDFLPFVPRGYLGVDFFFILSGFIITHIYFSSLAQPSAKATRIFFWHRLIRLYPVHVTTLAALVAMAGVAHVAGISVNNPQMFSLKDLYAHLLLIHAWGVIPAGTWNTPAWSISAEWFAYLLFPAIAPLLLMLRSRWSAWLVAAGALVVMASMLALTGSSLPYSWDGLPALLRVTGEFICGAAMRRALMLAPGVGWRMEVRGADVLGFTAIAGYFIGASIGLPDLPLIMFLAATIWAGAVSTGPMTRLLSLRPIAWLGDTSYSIYMVHIPVLIVCRQLFDAAGFLSWSIAGQRVAYFGSILLVIGIAALMYYVVERPTRQRLRNWVGVNEPARALN